MPRRKKSQKVSPEEAEIQFIKSLGYDTTNLEKIKDVEKLRSELAAAKEKVMKIEEVKKHLAKYEIGELEGKIKLLKEKMGNIDALDEILNLFEEIKQEWNKIMEMKLKDELASIEVPGFEEEILRIWKMFGKESIEEIEKEVKSLMQKVKERFFELQIVSSIATAEKANAQKGVRARPEEIFLMDLNGKVVLRYVRKWRVENKSVYARLLGEIYKLQKDLDRAFAYASKKFDSNLYELGLMRGTKFYMGIVATKDLHAMAEQFLDKTLHLLEERYSPETISPSGVGMVLKAFLNVYNKVCQISEDINTEFQLLTNPE